MGKKKYRCKKHRSNNGYVGPDGKWYCWKCTKENKYFYPKGTVIDRYTNEEEKREVRTVATGPRTIHVELWDISNYTLIDSKGHQYLSTAIRSFGRIVEDIENGNRRNLVRDIPAPRRVRDEEQISIPRINTDGEEYTVTVPLEHGIQTTEQEQPIPEGPDIIRGKIFVNENISSGAYRNCIFVKCTIDSALYWTIVQSRNYNKCKDCDVELGDGMLLSLAHDSFNEREVRIIAKALELWIDGIGQTGSNEGDFGLCQDISLIEIMLE